MDNGKNHTFDLHIMYHRCPKCGYIVESRKNFTYSKGVYEKKLTCQRCHATWKEKSPHQLQFGPLIGHELPKAEVDWE